MAKKGIPDPLERRLLVEREISKEQAQRIADAYLADDRVWEAIAFLAKAGATERLAAVRDGAIAAGDAFLVREVTRALGDAVDAAQWLAVAAAADAAGKERFAAQARRLAERAGNRP
jgi:hypothetical protein